MKRNEVRLPAGWSSHDQHSGGSGAPPGLTTKPCQELADDRKVQTTKRLPLVLHKEPEGEDPS